MNTDPKSLLKTTNASSPVSVARFDVPARDTASLVPVGGVRVPLELIGPYPMIRGSVNGQAGRFMLDVGTRMGVLLNNNLLDLGPGHRIGQGVADSGQPVTLTLHDNVERLEFWSGAVLDNVSWAHSANFEFVQEGIADDFLGFIGTGLLAPYEFTLDYPNGSVFFSRLTPDGTPLARAYVDKDVVAILPFHTPNASVPYEPVLPVIAFTLGEFTIPLSVDTGNPNGKLILTQKVKSALETAGRLISNGAGFEPFDVTYGEFTISLKGVEIEVGETEHGILGYSLLHLFTSAWNYQASAFKLIRQRS